MSMVMFAIENLGGRIVMENDQLTPFWDIVNPPNENIKFFPLTPRPKIVVTLTAPFLRCLGLDSFLVTPLHAPTELAFLAEVVRWWYTSISTVGSTIVYRMTFLLEWSPVLRDVLLTRGAPTK
jgi:hypothetical protein